MNLLITEEVLNQYAIDTKNILLETDNHLVYLTKPRPDLELELLEPNIHWEIIAGNTIKIYQKNDISRKKTKN